MGFRVHTNSSSLNAISVAKLNNGKITNSLEKLSSGLRINKAADDSSGMMIANSLRSQSNSLNQSIKNLNDGIGIIQTADKAMDEQSKILDTIKTKATQAAQDGQTEDTRKALQKDVIKLMEELDNIAETTSFNGQALLSGQYTDKKFQIGGNSNETVSVDISATSSDKIGHTRFETTASMRSPLEVKDLVFKDLDGMQDVEIENVIISHSAGTGLGVLTEAINKNTNQLGIKASWTVTDTGVQAIASGTVSDLVINGIQIGSITDVEANDRDGRLVNAINELSDKHGLIASVDERGFLELKSTDGRGIRISGTDVESVMGLDDGVATGNDIIENYGRLTLTRLDGIDIQISSSDSTTFSKLGISSSSESTINLRDIKRGFTFTQADSMGMFSSKNDVKYLKATDVKTTMAGTISDNTPSIGAGVTTLEGAMAVMSIAESSVKHLDDIRGTLGATQNQMLSTLNNISVTEVNIKSAESVIRDVDFASESASFQKSNLLSQAGNYVIGQANQQSQGVMQLLK
jgi:flagellin